MGKVTPTMKQGLLLTEAQWALGLSQRELAKRIGSSERTMSRIHAGHSSLYETQILELARALFPAKPELAKEAAAHLGKTLEQLGIGIKPAAQAPAPSEPAPNRVPPRLIPMVVRSILYSTSEALSMPREVLRPALLEALSQAHEAGLTLQELVQGLAGIEDAPRRAKVSGS